MFPLGLRVPLAVITTELISKEIYESELADQEISEVVPGILRPSLAASCSSIRRDVRHLGYNSEESSERSEEILFVQRSVEGLDPGCTTSDRWIPQTRVVYPCFGMRCGLFGCGPKEAVCLRVSVQSICSSV